MFSWAELFTLYNINPDNHGDQPGEIAPMSLPWIVRIGHHDLKRKRDRMRWGWGAHGDESYPKHIHARAETIDQLPTFRDAFRAGWKGRGVLFVDRFNEGKEERTFYSDGEDANKPWTRQYRFHRKDRQPFPIAVIFDERNVGGMPRECFVMVTTAANEMISRITDRMPAILRPEDLETWLGENDASHEEAKALLRPFEFDGEWQMYPEDPNKKPPTRKRPAGWKPAKAQGDLF
jgi:putative SOS response-associated peptidase YedK